LKPSCDGPLLCSTSAFSPWRQTSRKQRSAILDVPLPERPLRTVHAALPARNFSFRLSRLWALKSSWTEVQLLHRVSDKSGMLPQVSALGRKRPFALAGRQKELCRRRVKSRNLQCNTSCPLWAISGHARHLIDNFVDLSEKRW